MHASLLLNARDNKLRKRFYEDSKAKRLLYTHDIKTQTPNTLNTYNYIYKHELNLAPREMNMNVVQFVHPLFTLCAMQTRVNIHKHKTYNYRKEESKEEKKKHTQYKAIVVKRKPGSESFAKPYT